MEIAAKTNPPTNDTTGGRQMVVIDDDDLSRDVLTLIAMEAGFEVRSFASGEDALAALTETPKPAVILTDMQMPGISGAALAERLRELCGESTTLLAMSGSPVAREKLAGYGGFLLKPFSAEELNASCEGVLLAEAEPVETRETLNEAIFQNFARSMPGKQVFALYAMCLDDSAKRLEAMRKALDTGDDAAYRRAAHAIKGGCGMVGALELAKLAGEMEIAGLSAEADLPLLGHFASASARLRRMLDIKARSMQAYADDAVVLP